MVDPVTGVTIVGIILMLVAFIIFLITVAGVAFVEPYYYKHLERKWRRSREKALQERQAHYRGHSSVAQ